MNQGETLARLFVDIMNGHDAGRFAGLVSENYVNHHVGAEQGRAGLISFFTGWFAGMPDTHVEAHDIVVSGDTVVGRFSYRGHITGPWLGLPASGAEVNLRSIDIWRVRDGLFVEHWDELNTLEVFQAIGAVVPAPLT